MSPEKKASDKSALQAMSPEAREDVLRHYRANAKDMVKFQRAYKNLLGKPILNKVENIKKINFFKNLEQLAKEKEEILANLQVALGKVHVEDYEYHMRTITAHVVCQEELQESIEILYREIKHLQHQHAKTEAAINKIKFKAKSEDQYKEQMKKAKRALEILENQLDVSKKRECAFITDNMRLRQLVIDMLYERSLFNKLWTRMMTLLSHDKKFLIDLAERAIDCFEHGSDIYRKMDTIKQKMNRDIETKVSEMQELVKRAHSDKYNMKFLQIKGKVRELADLEPREYKRREIFRVAHRQQIDLYKAILDKILKFSGVRKISDAIDKFQKQEDIFYSYFNYMNDLSFQVQMLHKSLKDVYQGITTYKTYNIDKEANEKAKIEDLERDLLVERFRNQEKDIEVEAYEHHLNHLFKIAYEIFNMLRCDPKPLLAILGDHTKMTVFNVSRFLKSVERQLNSIIAAVYALERIKKVRMDQAVVHSIRREIVDGTLIENIVLAQQCAECAQGEDVNPYDEEFVMPKDMEEIKEELREKVVQPEMQYRLHSISQCRLPRSRLLANKRY